MSEVTSLFHLSQMISDRVENRTKCDEINMESLHLLRFDQWTDGFGDSSEYPSLKISDSIHQYRVQIIIVTPLYNERFQYMSVSMQINISTSSALTLLFRMFIIGDRYHVVSETRVVTISKSRFHTRYNMTYVTRDKIVNRILFEWHVFDHHRNVDVILSKSVFPTHVAYRIRARS